MVKVNLAGNAVSKAHELLRTHLIGGGFVRQAATSLPIVHGKVSEAYSEAIKQASREDLPRSEAKELQLAALRQAQARFVAPAKRGPEYNDANVPWEEDDFAVSLAHEDMVSCLLYTSDAADES